MATSSSITTNPGHGVPLFQTWLKTTLAPTRSVVAITSYIAIAMLAVFAISSLFCTFFFVSLFDDLVSAIDPRRLLHIDWTRLAERLRAQLTHVAEWEKRKRKTWTNHHANEGRFHDLLLAVSDYLDAYVHNQRQKPSSMPGEESK